MKFWADLSSDTQMIALAVLGACLGSLVNWAVYTLAYDARPISPWAKPPAGVKRSVWSRVPVLGWLFLRSESKLHGTAFWFRPVIVELLTAAALPALYIFVVDERGLLPANHPNLAPTSLSFHVGEFVNVTVLLGLMLAASLIDFDEKTIPDAITVPGTLLGLVLAALLPEAFPPVTTLFPPEGQPAVASGIRLTSPKVWPPELFGSLGLILGLGCFAWWCFALCERPWRMRRGLAVACKLFCARLWRGLTSPVMLVIATVGCAGIVAGWYLGGVIWEGLLTALVGMTISGGMIWIVRLVGQLALQKEAMGFGDVTLMAMLGTFLGWQACVIIFFVAPVMGLVIGVGQYLFRRENEIPYGPFLCLAACIVLLAWAPIWHQVRMYYILGWTILAILGVGFVLMGAMLFIWRLIADRFFPVVEDGDD